MTCGDQWAVIIGPSLVGVLHAPLRANMSYAMCVQICAVAESRRGPAIAPAAPYSARYIRAALELRGRVWGLSWRAAARTQHLTPPCTCVSYGLQPQTSATPVLWSGQREPLQIRKIPKTNLWLNPSQYCCHRSSANPRVSGPRPSTPCRMIVSSSKVMTFV